MYKRTGPVNKKRRTLLRAAAILAVFALKKNFEFGWKPPVHILDNNAVSVGTTATGSTRSIQGRDQRQLRQRPARSELAGRPRHEEIFRSMAKYYADGDKACDRASLVTSKLTHNRQVQACKKRRIRRLTSEMWFRVGRLFHRPTIFALNAGSHRGCRGWSGVDAVLARILL
jgi:hypothetical protein